MMKSNQNQLGASSALTGKEFEHKGIRIYPTLVRFGDGVKQMWGVESFENKAKREAGVTLHAFGNYLFEDTDQAIEAAESQIRDRIQDERARIEREEQAKAQAQSEAERLADTYNGFLVGKSPNVSELIRKALSKQWRFSNGQVMTVRERIESLHRDGKLEVSTFQETKIKPMSRIRFFRASQGEQDAHERRMREAGMKTTYLVNGSMLGKYAYDYASHLLAEGISAG